jgi:hypothetical protein
VTPMDPRAWPTLTERERARLAERLPRSIAFAKRASQSSIAHTENDPARSVEAFVAFATDLTA